MKLQKEAVTHLRPLTLHRLFFLCYFIFTKEVRKFYGFNLS